MTVLESFCGLAESAAVVVFNEKQRRVCEKLVLGCTRKLSSSIGFKAPIWMDEKCICWRSTGDKLQMVFMVIRS